VSSFTGGSAGDAINQAMITIHAALAQYDAKMLLQVHDELLFELPEKAAEEFSFQVQKSMEAIKETFNLIVPIKAEPTIGKNWLEAKS